MMIQDTALKDHSGMSEVILTPPLTAKISSVATNAGVSWGPGNDSVTSGTSPNIAEIPVKSTAWAWRRAVELLFPLLSGVREFFEFPVYPYLELVEHKETVQLVQVRDGPEQPGGHNYVPRTFEVKEVLTAHVGILLLEWERKIESLENLDGLIVYAPRMSLSSHYCVHAIAKGIPVVTEHCPEVGQIIKASTGRPKMLRQA